MAIKLIGKSILGNLGFCQIPQKMEDEFCLQLNKIQSHVSGYSLIMTSMTGVKEIEATNAEYFPKIRIYDPSLFDMFSPKKIYQNCKAGRDPLRPGSDFIICDYSDPSHSQLALVTFSREAPILYFESTSKKVALGVILRPSLMKYGDYLFSTIEEALGEKITCYLVTCNHFEYSEGSIPHIVENLAHNHNMHYMCMYDSESYEECYHRGESGNHVVIVSFK